MDGITLAMIIDGVPIIVGLVGVLMLVNAIVAASGYRGGAEETPPRIAPALIVLLFGFWLAFAPSILLPMGELNKSGLSFGEYLQREIPLGKNSEWARRMGAKEFNGEDSPEALAEGSEPSQPAKARLESGAVGQESESSAHVETEQPKPLPPTPAVEPAKVAPIIEKLASPEEARSAADAKALWEVCLGVAVALVAGAAAWIAARRKRVAAPAETLPEVQFLDGGRNAAFAESDIFAKTAAFHEAKAPSEQP